jgi:hypothetical protein
LFVVYFACFLYPTGSLYKEEGLHSVSVIQFDACAITVFISEVHVCGAQAGDTKEEGSGREETSSNPDIP